jgi:hypothetical protein
VNKVNYDKQTWTGHLITDRHNNVTETSPPLQALTSLTDTSHNRWRTTQSTIDSRSQRPPQPRATVIHK